MEIKSLNLLFRYEHLKLSYTPVYVISGDQNQLNSSYGPSPTVYETRRHWRKDSSDNTVPPAQKAQARCEANSMVVRNGAMAMYRYNVWI